MNADRLYMARIAHVHSYAAGAWRNRVTVYDLGHRTESRPFLKLDLAEQAFVVARIAMREHQRLDAAKDAERKSRQGSGVSSAASGVSSTEQPEMISAGESSDASRAPADAAGGAQ